MRGRWLLLALAACGARTELGAPEVADASFDAAHDAPVDSPHDSPADSPADSPIDAPTVQSGCADGQREGFEDQKQFPTIAACAGGFEIGGVMPFSPASPAQCPGVATHDTVVPACNHQAGDDGPNPKGVGCNIADLCAVGWHVCAGAADVTANSPSGCDGATHPNDPPTFWATRQSSNGCANCATGTLTGSQCDSKTCAPGCVETAATSNDVFGCGNTGNAGVAFVGCDPLDSFTNNACSALAGTSWSCAGDPTGFCEAYVLAHLDSTGGGALCCHDEP